MLLRSPRSFVPLLRGPGAVAAFGDAQVVLNDGDSHAVSRGLKLCQRGYEALASLLIILFQHGRLAEQVFYARLTEHVLETLEHGERFQRLLTGRISFFEVKMKTCSLL